MNSLIAWFARNGVVANLVMFLIVLLGILGITTTNQELFPDIDAEMITVTVPYRGAAPEEVEEGVCVRIEEAIQGLEGIERITSSAAEGSGTVLIEVETGYDTRTLLDDVKARVDAISTFPVETEQPVIQELVARAQVINISIAGDADERTLKLLGERVRDEVLALPEISQADLNGARPYEVSIEVSEDALRRYGLSFDEIVRAVRRSSQDLPGGAVKAGAGEILLRTKGQAYVGEEFENLTLLARPDGSRLRVRDVASVVDGFEETDLSSRFDGQPGVMVQVFRVGEENVPEIAAAVHRYVEQARERMPAGITLSTWRDDSKMLADRTSLLVRNGLTGLLLVFIILTLFLRMRLALWVGVGIPVAFFGAFAVMPHFGATINMMTLFSFILVLGIVVDDAIVVGERIHFRQKGMEDGLRGAILGTQEVAMPVIFGVLTTMSVFAPFMFIPGMIGNFTRSIPIVVISALFFSLVESQLVLPYHLSHRPEHPEPNGSSIVARAWNGFFEGFDRFVEWLIRRTYRPALARALRWRYLAAALALSLLFFAIGLVRGGMVEMVFFPEIDSDIITVALTMPQETPSSITAAAIEGIEQTTRQLGRDLEREHGEPMILHVLSSVGEQPMGTTPVNISIGGGRSYVGGLAIELRLGEQRSFSSSQVANRLRQMLDPIPGAVELEVNSSLVMGGGKPIDIQLSGPDVDELRELAARIMERLSEYPGVTDISNSYRGGKPEIRLDIRPEAETLGLTLDDLGRQVRQGFFGEEVQRIQRGRDDVRVMVRYPLDERSSLGSLERMRIRTAEGGEVPFSTVASAETGRGFASIKRVDRERAVNITASVDEDLANADNILAELDANFFPALLADHGSVRYSLEGQQDMQSEFMTGLIRSFLVALFAVFALMAIPFRSYLQPLIVMSAIPFGIAGAVFGHAIAGMTLSFMSMLGIVAVAGVVVNDSLVLVHFINRQDARSGGLYQAVEDAGVQRFRPIILTSLTTAAGVTPLILERSLQAQFLIPMAVSMASGVLFATFITLLVVPCGYLILEDLRRLLGISKPAAAAADPREPGLPIE